MNASTMTGAGGYRSRTPGAKIDFKRHLTPRNGIITIVALLIIAALFVIFSTRWPAAFTIAPDGSVIESLQQQDLERGVPAEKVNANDGHYDRWALDIAERIGDVPVVVTPLGGVPMAPTTDYRMVRTNYSDTARFEVDIPVWAGDRFDPKRRRLDRADGTCLGRGCP